MIEKEVLNSAEAPSEKGGRLWNDGSQVLPPAPAEADSMADKDGMWGRLHFDANFSSAAQLASKLKEFLSGLPGLLDKQVEQDNKTLEQKLDKKLDDISTLRNKGKLTSEEAKKVRDVVVEKYLSDNGVGTPALPDSPPSSPVAVIGRR